MRERPAGHRGRHAGAACAPWARLALCVLLATFAAFVALGPAQAQDVQPVPALGARIIDRTGTLSAAQRDALDAKLAAFEAQSGPQIVVLLVPTTQPEDIASYAQRVADTWKIGRRAVGDGLLVVVAKNDRQVRIEVAKALEGAVPDLAARQIIDNAIRPAFRADDYAGGLNAAVDQLIARIKGEGLPAPVPAARQSAQPGLQLDDVWMFFFVGVPVVGALLTGLFGRKLGSLLTAGAAGGLGWWLTASLLVAGGAALASLVLVGLFGIGAALRGRGGGPGLPHIGGFGGGGWGGGGSWGGGGGGGFSSGGGGDFGGGGASGSW
ncbi:MAG: TPM domain-containing protein [Burkholderiales bacterium]|nr:TPM domain-containing protein [Burkholderiales bacterium]